MDSSRLIFKEFVAVYIFVNKSIILYRLINNLDSKIFKIVLKNILIDLKTISITKSACIIILILSKFYEL